VEISFAKSPWAWKTGNGFPMGRRKVLPA
jgi:hypothetical protein